MPAGKNVHLAMPPILVAEMKAVADAEGKTLDEVAQNAAQRYLEDRRWRRVVSYGHDRASRLSVTDEDVTRLITESRGGQ